jgi:hypothetical protein
MKTTFRIVTGLWMIGAAFALTAALYLLGYEHPEEDYEQY